MIFYVNFLVWVGGVDAEGVLVVDVGDPHLGAVGPSDGDDHVLADGHRQHRVALVVDVLPDQIDPPWGAGEERGAGGVDGVEAVPEAGEAEARLVELRARAVDRLQRGERRHELRRLGGGGGGGGGAGG